MRTSKGDPGRSLRNRDGYQTKSNMNSFVDVNRLESQMKRCKLEVDQISRRMKAEQVIFSENAKLEQERQHRMLEKRRPGECPSIPS
jgi:hypothetical protein